GVGRDARAPRVRGNPKVPRRDAALVGIYMRGRQIFEAAERIKPSWRGELEITAAIQWLVDNGRTVHPYVHQGWWIDTGAPGDMLSANDLVLEEIKHSIVGYVDRESRVDHRVTIQRGAEIINSIVRGPAIIGENTRIINSYTGPYT